MQFKKPNNAMELDHAEPTAYYPLIKRLDEETEEPMIYN